MLISSHWGKADDRNCNYGHSKKADVESGKNLFCRLNCFYNVFQMTHALVDSNLLTFHKENPKPQITTEKCI